LYEPKSKVAFVGDNLFADGSIGRTDFPYCNSLDLAKSLKKIKSLPSGTRIYPGHGESFLL
jgi:glyoxylase-like metal-dependent hydrolase (beta-lactamase superfamily II)